MKNVMLVVGGICAAAAGLLVLRGRRGSVQELAHQLEVEWAAEHHTVV